MFSLRYKTVSAVISLPTSLRALNVLTLLKLNAANEDLEFAAFKYGLDPNGENFLADLKKAMEADDTFV